MTIPYNRTITNTINALYHMTHVDNLLSILEYGLMAHGNAYQVKDISNHQVNRRRSRCEPIYGYPIHSYVPFYINPKNAMLYALREMQDDIIILVFDKGVIEGRGVLFTDGNASSDETYFSNDLSKLSILLDWRVLRATKWNSFLDGRRKRMAEVLVPNRVGGDRLKKIICNTQATYARLCKICPSGITIEIDHRFYF
jgi:hypothetical protein